MLVAEAKGAGTGVCVCVWKAWGVKGQLLLLVCQDARQEKKGGREVCV